MTVSFNQIPAGNSVRVPLFYAEMDNSQAFQFSQNLRGLIIGHKLTAGTAAVNTPQLVPSVGQAIALYGRGSMLARMVEYYRLSNLTGELWCMAVAENGAGVAATGTITVTASTAGAGTIQLYIGYQKISVAVAASDPQNTIATNIAAAINAALDLPVTAAAATNIVTLTCRWKGLTGNDITVLDSFRGPAGGENLPTGVSLAYSGSGLLTGGTTSPAINGAPIAALGDDAYDFIINPFADSASLDAFQTELGDSSGRWSWSRQVYGHAYSALRGTLSTLVTAGNLRNDPHHTIAGIDVDCPNPSWEYAASYGGRNAVFIGADPGRPTQTGELTGIAAPRAGKRFTWTERNSLLNAGIATSMVSGGSVLIERAITTYRVNTFNQPDVSYLDSETLHQSAYILRYLKSAITQKYPRHKLANDGTRFGAGQAIVTPSVIRGELLAAYAVMEDLGIVENGEAFNEYLIVERDSLNPNRINVLFPPDYVNQLRVVAVLNQFRLQYPAVLPSAA
jgi:phage tail sheath gpL-like